MSRRLTILNAVLVLVAALAVIHAVRELRAPTPTSSAARRPAPPSTPVNAPAPAVAETPPGGYSVVASRNLFSPTRSETPPSPIAAGPAAAKPNLYGILLRDGSPVAYLEDPATKRVSGYRLGDSVAGGTLIQITSDAVVLNRPDGDMNVRLRDPSKPRPPIPTPAQPGPTPVLPTPAMPGAPPVTSGPVPVIPPSVVPPAQIPPQQPAAPGVLPPGLPPLPRRPLPPNISRRLPPAGTDAPARD